jgi:hypothetical protein
VKGEERFEKWNENRGKEQMKKRNENAICGIYALTFGNKIIYIG